MSSFLGVRPDGVHELVAELRRWGVTVEPIISLVSEAESLADYPTGAIGLLSDLGSDGQAMAARVQRASNQIESYHLALPPVSPLLGGGDRRLFAWADEPAGPPPPAAQIDQHLGGTLIELGRLDRADELRGEIRRDTAAGRDPGPKFTELQVLLTTLAGGSNPSSPSQVASAMSLLMKDIPASDLAGGSDRALGRIAAAMADGKTPQAADLPESVFPDAYVAWHRSAGDLAATEMQLERNDHLLEQLQDIAISGINRGSVQDQIQALNLAVGARAELVGWLEATYPGLETSEHYQLGALLASDSEHLQGEVDSLRDHLAALQVDTLDRGAALDSQGSLAVFDAIGATAATLPILPSTFVGSTYGIASVNFTFDEFELSTARLAGDPEAAVSFFSVISPERAAHLLTDVQRSKEERTTDGRFETTQVAHDLSVAFGHASDVLPPAYAAEVIGERPSSYTTGPVPIAPEWLFAHGDFDPSFLLAGAARSLGNDPGTHGGASREIAYGLVDPRHVILGAVVQQGMGVELVIELDRTGQLDRLVWNDNPIVSPSSTEAPMAAVTQLLLQAGASDEASAALIDVAGSQLGDLDIDVANAMSVVLGMQIPKYLDVSFESPYFAAVNNVFSAGAGVDLHFALRAAQIDQFVDQIENGIGTSWDGIDPLARLTARVDTVRFDVLRVDAEARDRSIRHTDVWVSGLTAGAGILTGVVSLPATGTAAVVLTGTGAGSSLAGFIAPHVLADADNVVSFLDKELVSRTGESSQVNASLLVAAARTDYLTFDGASFAEGLERDGLYLELTVDGEPPKLWLVDWHEPEWPLALVHELEVAGAVGPDGRSASLVLNELGGKDFSDNYDIVLGRGGH